MSTTPISASWTRSPPRSSPSVIAQLGGSTQQIPGGHVLVAFGNAGRVEEYDAAGRMVWRVKQPGYIFRAYRIRSLYGEW